MRRRAIALACVWLLIAQPAAVSASVYSSMTFQMHWSPWHQIYSNVCTQSGVVTTISNYGYTLVEWAGNPTNNLCTNGTVEVEPSEIGVKVKGYRSGVLCGASNWYYNTVYAFGWQLWIQLCSDQSGYQAFHTDAYSTAKKAGENLDWFYGGAVTSPPLVH
jgi:hypothetical protein